MTRRNSYLSRSQLQYKRSKTETLTTQQLCQDGTIHSASRVWWDYDLETLLVPCEVYGQALNCQSRGLSQGIWHQVGGIFYQEIAIRSQGGLFSYWNCGALILQRILEEGQYSAHVPPYCFQILQPSLPDHPRYLSPQVRTEDLAECRGRIAENPRRSSSCRLHQMLRNLNQLHLHI